MIIKIKDGSENSWWIFSEVQKVRYEVGIEEKDLDKDVSSEDFDINIANIRDHTFAKIIFRNVNGEEKCIRFNTIAYICNEQGQTIEKIVP